MAGQVALGHDGRPRGRVRVHGPLTCATQAPARLSEKARHLAIVFDPSIYRQLQGVYKRLVDNAPSVGIVRCSKNPGKKLPIEGEIP